MDLKYYSATCCGASHLESGRPCQDRAYAGEVAVGDGRGVLLAVADGHGHELHYRSDAGAQFVVEAVVELMPRFTAHVLEALPDGKTSGKGGTAVSGSDECDALFRSFFKRLCELWVSKILAHYRANPPAEPVAAAPALAYGTTVAAAIAVDRFRWAFQLGDGMAGMINADGSVAESVPSDSRCRNNLTTSMCSCNEGDFRYTWSRSVPPAFILTTDGLVNSFGDAAELLQTFLGGVVNKIAESGFDYACRSIDEVLPQISADFSRDDMGVAFWVDMQRVEALSKTLSQATGESLDQSLAEARRQLDDCRLSISSLMEHMERLRSCEDDPDAEDELVRSDAVLATLKRQQSMLLELIGSIVGDLSNVD